MVIKKIFTKIKNQNKKPYNNDTKNINKINITKLKANQDEDSNGDVNFRNGLEIFFSNGEIVEKKVLDIKQSEEGSNEETFKKPKIKAKEEEIYSDATDKPFEVSKEKKDEELEEFKITSITNPETGENKIKINKSKKIYNRSF